MTNGSISLYNMYNFIYSLDTLSLSKPYLHIGFPLSSVFSNSWAGRVNSLGTSPVWRGAEHLALDRSLVDWWWLMFVSATDSNRHLRPKLTHSQGSISQRAHFRTLRPFQQGSQNQRGDRRRNAGRSSNNVRRLQSQAPSASDLETTWNNVKQAQSC